MFVRPFIFLVPLCLPTIVWSQTNILSVLGPDDAILAEYTIEDLDSLDQTSYATTNAFVDDETAFSGPLISAVLADAGAVPADDGTVAITAINDYAVEIPVTDLTSYDVIFATRVDGEEMSIREKGPIWVMYPISDFPELDDALYSSRLIWQVKNIKLLE